MSPPQQQQQQPPADPSSRAGAAAGDDDEEDPFITRIKNSGCFPQHEALQDCYFDKKDWRACKDEMKAFRACFAKNNAAQQQQQQHHQ
ncbi:hypothetical protein HDU87_001656 [Geranomyces variabilis]|uniref:CHCH domain-containing protein n=1 Tax=Geranomyces variabilis TaxID=109894 RepID=A0AAD5TMZ3_9FUNG|nr:hypothetical protein HDU87_001656 [Geranomyces variabilis]